ncbi:hypothetical protein [Litchfieldia salsa]|uniref:Uncharacterized protein n=1 Tax=Litchfieldia salsa TaxID=930152 RepID=A0A1H0Q6H9_9BACI|nr:hypothetical protein [Litchfieldia salsa]SDP12645.1 hypothetical protein SAMN05216565_101613 [Litchfieldia salsa]
MSKKTEDQVSGKKYKGIDLQGHTDLLESKEGVTVQEDGFRYDYDDSSDLK